MGETMPDQVAIFDTTLRDGEQAAGTRLGSREKLTLARQLARLRVDVIEAGYPASSPEDFEAVRQIAEEIEGPAVCALSRAVPRDIEACGRALAKARRPRIHTGIGASDIHVMGKFRDERYGRTLEEKRATILRMAADAVKLARSFADDVEFYAEDAGRAEPSFLYLMLETAIAAGATVVNIPDTTGTRAGAVRGARRRHPRPCAEHRARHHQRALPRRPGPGRVQCAGGPGQRRAPGEGTINGVGERAGNASLEEIVMALRTRFDHYNLSTGIDAREFCRTSRMVSEMLGIPVSPNKAVVGANAFAHSSGIHVDGFLKERLTYEIMRPEDVGFGESRVVLTARTGRAGLRDRVERLGYALSAEELDALYQRFLLVADKKQEVFDEDLSALLHGRCTARRTPISSTTCTSTAAPQRFPPPPSGCGWRERRARPPPSGTARWTRSTRPSPRPPEPRPGWRAGTSGR